jgi:hypothetical protein
MSSASAAEKALSLSRGLFGAPPKPAEPRPRQEPVRKPSG